MFSDGRNLIGASSVQTLINCGGLYSCPHDESGAFQGLLVGCDEVYFPDDEESFVTAHQKQYVKTHWFNFSRADQWPVVLTYFAQEIQNMIEQRALKPTVILGAPVAGLKLAQEVSRIMGCRSIFAEKQPFVPNPGIKIMIENLVLRRYEIKPGDKVIIVEESVSDFVTTVQLITLVQSAGGTVIGIACVINHSHPFRNRFLVGDRRLNNDGIPVVSIIEQPTPQYKQDDPAVAQLVASGKVVWKPERSDWVVFQEVMQSGSMKP